MNVSAQRPTVLFVDDEENVLLGLKRMLRSRRSAWNMAFASSGSQALDYLAKNQAQVVVSDMRMPGMDGAELLTRIRKLYPGTVRIVLSGFTEREAILQTIGPSHRYLAKPCSEEALTKAVESSLRLRSTLRIEDLQGILTQISHVPTLPQVYAEILTELSAEFGSAEVLAEKIEKDIGLTAQLLKLTNSAYFSLPVKCATVKQAINFLGFDNIRATVLLAGVFEQFRNVSPSLLRVVEVLTHRSLGIAVLAQAISRADNQTSQAADQAFCAGLLSHVGTLILIANWPVDFTSAMARIDRDHIDILEAERTSFGATHAELGAYLLGLWGFNDAVVEAVAHHHLPSAYTLRPAPVLTAVHVAQHLAKVRRSSSGKNDLDGLDYVYLDACGLASHVSAWRNVLDGVSKDWPHE